jgi:hypothetical protein
MEFSRMQFAQWVLERNLEWVSAADVKAGTIFAIDAAMLGALAAFFQAADANARTPLEMLLSVAAAVCATDIYLLRRSMRIAANEGAEEFPDLF